MTPARYEFRREEVCSAGISFYAPQPRWHWGGSVLFGSETENEVSGFRTRSGRVRWLHELSDFSLCQTKSCHLLTLISELCPKVPATSETEEREKVKSLKTGSLKGDTLKTNGKIKRYEQWPRSWSTEDWGELLWGLVLLFSISTQIHELSGKCSLLCSLFLEECSFATASASVSVSVPVLGA